MREEASSKSLHFPSGRTVASGPWSCDNGDQPEDGPENWTSIAGESKTSKSNSGDVCDRGASGAQKRVTETVKSRSAIPARLPDFVEPMKRSLSVPRRSAPGSMKLSSTVIAILGCAPAVKRESFRETKRTLEANSRPSEIRLLHSMSGMRSLIMPLTA